MNDNTIYSYIKSQETSYQTEEISVGDNWQWNMRKHIQMIFHLKNNVFYTGDNTFMRAFKGVMEPMLNLSHWIEAIENKDVVFYIEDDEYGKVLSFLVKKYYDEIYTHKHNLDKMFEDGTESDIDYGGLVMQKGVTEPEVLPLMAIAFCDQTDVLGGPIGFKHYFSPDKMRSMSSFGWGDEKNGATVSLDDLCDLAVCGEKNAQTNNNKKNAVSGKAIEVYIVRGSMPHLYLDNGKDEEYYCNQVQVVAFYVKENGEKEGVTLYKKKEDEGNLKFFTSKEVYQRGLGRGTGEIMLHPQIWTNFLTIHKTNMLEAASKVPLYTDDPAYTSKNKIQDMENLEITVIEEGKVIRQVPTAAPGNISVISNEINEWYNFAQTAASAQSPIMGDKPSSGTTFRGQNQIVNQGKGIHEYRKGKRAKFFEEVYRDWIIPDIKREILKGNRFLASLTTDELEWISDTLAIRESNEIIRQSFINGKPYTKDEQDALIQTLKTKVQKRGNRRLVEILKSDFEDVEIKMGIDIAGKQKDLAQLSDKLLSILQFVYQNPELFKQAMQDKGLAKAFSNILEASNMSIADFSSLLNAPKAPATASQQPTASVPTPSGIQINQPA